MPTIRPYTDRDLDSVIALWREAGLLVPHNDPAQDIAFCRQSGHGEVFLGARNGRLVASIMVGHDSHRGWMYYLAVAPNEQRKGWGRQMVAHAESWLTAHGVWKVQLMIRGTNEPVRAFYGRLGYTEEDRIVMARWLNRPTTTAENHQSSNLASSDG